MSEYYDKVQEAAKVMVEELGHADLAVVLGSGLNGFTEHIRESKELPFEAIPGMPCPSVKGHSGKVVFGKLPNTASPNGEMNVLCFAGRVHGYEGWAPSKISFYARAAVAAGCKLLLLTNSSGGCLPGMIPGSVMIIKDHLRFTNMCPLEEYSLDSRLGPRHFSPSQAYNQELSALAKQRGQALGLPIHEGVYCWVPGPSYETPAEIQAGVKMGGGAFGMSTVPEVMATAALGAQVLALALATNLAAGLSASELSHEEVTQVAKEAGPKFQELVLDVINSIKFSEIPSPPKLTFSESDSESVSLGKEMWATGFTIKVASASLPRVPEVVIFTPNLDLIASNLEDCKSMNLLEIPGFATVAKTTTAICGKILFGSMNGKSVAVVGGGYKEGFNCFESWFLVAMLASAGCSSLVQVLPAVSLVPNDFAPGDIISVSSILDRSRNRMPGAPLRPSVPTTSLNTFHDTPSASLLYTPGPSLASPAEMNVGCLGGCQLASISNVSPSSMARLFSMNTNVFAFVCQNLSGSQNIDCLETLQDCARRCTPLTQGFKLPELDEGYVPTLQMVQERVLDVRAACRYLKSQITETFEDCVFASSLYSEYFRKQSIELMVECSTIPGWNGYCNNETSRWSLYRWNKNGKPILLILEEDSFDLHPSFYGLSFLIRVLFFFEIKNLLFLFQVSSLTDSDSEKFIYMSDHMNMTGMNPLTGPNEDEYGPRFPDMSYVYQKEMSGKFSLLNLKSSVCALTSDLTMSSECERALFKALGADSITTGAVREICVARHMGMTVNSVANVLETEFDESVLSSILDVVYE